MSGVCGQSHSAGNDIREASLLVTSAVGRRTSAQALRMTVDSGVEWIPEQPHLQRTLRLPGQRGGGAELLRLLSTMATANSCSRT
jgi:hypothetical protein